jgi:hypothetical protein
VLHAEACFHLLHRVIVEQAAGITPADQRLDARDVAGGEAMLRLKLQQSIERTVCPGAARVEFRLEPVSLNGERAAETVEHGGAPACRGGGPDIIPPLLNSLIGLQKDTALVNVIGSIDAFNQSIIIATNNFNLSPVTTVALLFIVITIPQARLVDRLIERDRRRMRIGS